MCCIFVVKNATSEFLIIINLLLSDLVPFKRSKGVLLYNSSLSFFANAVFSILSSFSVLSFGASGLALLVGGGRSNLRPA